MKNVTLFALGVFTGAVLVIFGLGFTSYKKPIVVNNNQQTSSPSASPTNPGKPPLNKNEVAKHSSPSDCWIIVKNKIYDVTSYLSDQHPGGAETITPYCGKEATNAFETKDAGSPHSNAAWSMLDAYYVGDLVI